MREAQANGEVISPAQIARAAELNDQIESLQHRIGQDLKQAFIDLGPDVEFAFEKLEHFTSQLAHLIGQVPDAVRGIADIANGLAHLPGVGGLLDLSGLKKLQDQGAANDDAYAKRVHDGQHPIAAFINDVATYDVRRAPADLARRGRAAALRLPDDPSTLADQLKAAGRDAEPTDRRVVDLSRFNAPKGGRGAKAAPQDQTASFNDAADNAALAAQRDLTSARKEMAATIRRLTEASTSEGRYAAAVSGADEEAQAKQDDITADLNAKLKKYDEQIAKARGRGGQGHGRQRRAPGRHPAGGPRSRGGGRGDQGRDGRRGSGRRQGEGGARPRPRPDQPGLRPPARHGRVRRAAAPRAGKLCAQQRRAAHRGPHGLGRRQVQPGHRAPAPAHPRPARGEGNKGRGRTAFSDLNAQFGVDQGHADELYGAQRKKTEYDDVGPLKRFAQEGARSAGEVRDAFEEIATKGLDQLNDGLADAIVNGKSLGDVFKSVFASMEGDLVKYLLKQAEIGIFGGGQGGEAGGAGSIFSAISSAFGIGRLPGHATGADSFGGATKIDEEGTEGVAFLPRNTQIIPNSTLRGLANLDPAKLGRGGGQITQQFHLHAEGAVMTDELVRGLSAQSQVLSRAAAADAVGQNNLRQARRARYSRPL